MHEIESIVLQDRDSYLKCDHGIKVGLDPVTDKNLLELVFDKKSKKLKSIFDFNKNAYLYVALSPLYQHVLRKRAEFGVYVVKLTKRRAAPPRYSELSGTYVLSYNDNVIMKVRN